MKNSAPKLVEIGDPLINGRLIDWADHSGAMNMSIDQALLDSVGHGGAPTLRWYGWSEPTLSLGYFQSHEEVRDWQTDWVRRSTGGGAIMHHHELTYSLTLPSQSDSIGSHTAIYQSVHAAVIDVLATLGITASPYHQWSRAHHAKPSDAPEPFLCFQRRTDEDLILSGYKILGSAQRRVRGGLLQHGSLLLSVSPHANVLPGIVQLSGQRIDRDAMMSGITDRVGERLGIDWQSGQLSDDEQTASKQIASERFNHPSWNQRR